MTTNTQPQTQQSGGDEPIAAFMKSLGFEWIIEEQQWYRTLVHSIGEFQGKGRGQYMHPELATFFYEQCQSRERAARVDEVEKIKLVTYRPEMVRYADKRLVVLSQPKPQAGEGGEG